eukprot:6467728-Amphidinium_carterae.1
MAMFRLLKAISPAMSDLASREYVLQQTRCHQASHITSSKLETNIIHEYELVYQPQSEYVPSCHFLILDFGSGELWGTSLTKLINSKRPEIGRTALNVALEKVSPLPVLCARLTAVACGSRDHAS